MLRLVGPLDDLVNRDLDRSGGGVPSTAADAAVSCEPPVVNLLVVEDNAADYALIERCLTHMARFEPRITLAGKNYDMYPERIKE